MSTVILLGAGASIPAGYPTANNLLPRIETFSHRTSLLLPGNNWSTWTTFRDSEQLGSLGLLLQANNPEIVLSALDLFPAVQDDFSRSLFAIAVAAIKGLTQNHEETTRLKALLGDKHSKAAQAARNALLWCLEEFLVDRLYDEIHHPEKRDYLRKIFKDLQPGDTVITFNWDTTAERTLAEMGLWNPTTGYGFDKRLIRGSVKSPNAINANVLPSHVHVLKLHGSVGWKRKPLDDEQVYFDNNRLLKHLPIAIPGEEILITFADPHFNGIEHHDPVIVAPTFLKAVPAGKDIQRIWFLASNALAAARRISVWGYSLPPSDAAARVLLNPLRFRLDEGDVEIIVRDPSSETRDRWDEFLGHQVSRNECLGDDDKP